MKFGKGWLALGILTFGLIVPVLCQAAVTGNCSNCHTMHNSEEGSPVAFTLDTSTGQHVTSEAPFVNLLKTDCLGCHTNPGSETIINVGEAVVPVVFNLAEPTYPPKSTVDSTSTLAGGNFFWVFSKGDEYGHNVTGITGHSDESRFPSQAPGGEARTGECKDCHVTLFTDGSGCQGCHVPMHHADNADVVVGKGKGWYRFLGSVMQQRDELSITEGVVGIEAADWEQAPSSTKHNVYQGKLITPPPLTPSPPDATYAGYLGSGSISQKCIGCHGRFHSQTIADSTWIRHPVNVAIPNVGEYVNFTTYDPLVPVSRPNVVSEDAGFSEIERGSDLVSCISCHRAHGSPYPAMLRWGYRDWPGTDSHTHLPALNGCAVCHRSKD